MLTIKYPIVVEGKYDMIKLSSLVKAEIIRTDGFRIFSKKETMALLRRLAEKSKLIIMTDSDGGGTVIRSHIRTAIPQDRLIHLYIPRVEGKEKRKSAPSKEGYLGVEGIDADKLRQMLAPFAVDAPLTERGGITKTDFYVYGLSGGESSRARRAAVAETFDLPPDMTANALLGALNILVSREDFIKICEEMRNEDHDEEA